jgi:hypothetical protein
VTTNQLVVSIWAIGVAGAIGIMAVGKCTAEHRKREQFDAICTDRRGVFAAKNDRFECRVDGVLVSEVCR